MWRATRSSRCLPLLFPASRGLARVLLSAHKHRPCDSYCQDLPLGRTRQHLTPSRSQEQSRTRFCQSSPGQTTDLIQLTYRAAGEGLIGRSRDDFTATTLEGVHPAAMVQRHSCAEGTHSPKSFTHLCTLACPCDHLQLMQNCDTSWEGHLDTQVRVP